MKNQVFRCVMLLFTLCSWQFSTAGAISAGPDGIVIHGSSQVCKGEQVTYSIYTPNPNYTYVWSISGSNGTITSTTATTATVLWHTLPSDVLVATASEGATPKGTGSKAVSISESPDPFITSTVSVGCASQILDPENPEPQDDSRCFVVCQGSRVVFTANGNAGSTFNWNATGGSVTSTTATTATVQFNTVGFGQITVTETTSAGCKETEIRCVEVIAKPSAEFQVIPASVFQNGVACVNSILSFIDLSTAGSGSPIVSWQWDFGDGTISNDPNPTHSYVSTGNYDITLTVENECHCTDVYSFSIEIIESEALNIECPSVVCEDKEVFYTVTDPHGCHNFQWEIIGGTATTGDPNNDPTIGITWDDVDQTGFGYISVESLCGEGCPTSLKIPVVKSVGEIEGVTQLCEGKEYLYRLPRWPATNFDWSHTGNAQVLKTDQPNEVVVVPFPGTSTVTLRCAYQNDLIGCGGKASIELNVVPPATFSGPEEACVDVASTYTLSGSFYGNWKLKNQAGAVVQIGSGHTFSPVFSSPGTHILSVTGAFCAPDPLEIEVMPSPPAVDNITGPDEVCTATPYTFSAGNSIPGTTLNWSVIGGSFPGGASTVSGEQATITFTGAGPYQVKVWRQYQSDLGCQSANLVKTVNKKQVSLSIEGATQVCANTYQDYSASYLTGDLYEWSIIPETMGSVVAGDGSRSVNILWNDLASGTATAQLQVKMRVCNTDYIETIDVDVRASASISLTGPSSICRTHSATFTVPTSLSSYGTVEWDFGDGSTATTSGVGALSTSHTFNTVPTGGTYTVTVKVNNANGCNKPATAQHVITIKPSPVGHITPGGSRVQCNGTSFNETLNASVPGGGATFQWFKNGVAIQPPATSATYTVTGTTGAVGNYYCELTSVANGCTSKTNTVSFSYINCSGGGCVVSGAPDISLTPTVTGCGEITVNLSNPNGGTNPTWSPAPSSSSGSNYTFDYSTSGTYFITYTVDRPDPNNPGSTCEHRKTVQVTVPFVGGLKYEVSCGSTPGQYDITLLDNSNYFPGNPITNFKFYISGTLVQNGTATSYSTTRAPGTYPIQLVIGNGGTHPNCTINDVIVLPALPVANFTFDADATCEGFPIQFVNTSTPATGLEYYWDFDGATGVRVKDPSRVFPSDGLKTVQLTITNELGCSATQVLNVNVKDNDLDGEVFPQNATVCQGGLTLTYSSNSGNPDIYYWQPDSFAIVTSGPSQQVYESGSYFVTVTDANKCTFSTQNVSVEFVPTPQAAITGPTDVCQGEDIKLYGDAGAGNYTYQWKRNGTVLNGFTSGNIVQSGLAPGIYVYELTVSISSPISCSTTATHTVEVHAPPAQPDFDIMYGECSPFDIILSVINPEPTGSYTWSDGQSGNSVNVGKGGAYTLTYTSPEGCTSSITKRADKSPWEYIWVYPLGCYEQCPEFNDKPFDIPDPIIDFDAWEIENLSWSHSNSTSPELPDMYWLSFMGSNAYSYSLSLNGCTANTKFADVTVLEECCELEVDVQPMDYIDEGEMCRNVIDIYFGNPSSQPITISLSSDLGVFVPNTVTVPPGGGNFTFEFFPYNGVSAGAAGTISAVSEYYEDPERKMRCTFEGNLKLPNPICDASMWKRGENREVVQAEETKFFALAPNPASTEVSVMYELPEWTETSVGKIEVHDLRGARMAEFDLNEGKGSQLLNTSNWKPSVYIIILRVDGEVKDYSRLIIQR